VGALLADMAAPGTHLPSTGAVAVRRFDRLRTGPGEPGSGSLMVARCATLTDTPEFSR